MGILHLFPRGTLRYDSRGMTVSTFLNGGRIRYDEILDMSFMKANIFINGHIKLKTKENSFLLFNFSMKRNSEAQEAYHQMTLLRTQYLKKKNSIKSEHENIKNNEGQDLLNKMQKQREERFKREKEMNKNENKSKNDDISSINTLTYGELTNLPGIGTLTAKMIISNRKKGKKIHSVYDLTSDYHISWENAKLIKEYIGTPSGNNNKFKNKRLIQEEKRLKEAKIKEEQFKKEKKERERKKRFEEQRKLNKIKAKREKLEQERKREEEEKLRLINEEKAKLKKQMDEEKEILRRKENEERKKIEEIRRQKEHLRQKELEKLAPININIAEIDVLKKVPHISLDKIETILNLRECGIYIKSWGDFKGKLSFNDVEINEIKKYVIIEDKEFTENVDKKINFNDADLIDLYNMNIPEEIIAQIILDRDKDIYINSFNDLKAKYSLTEDIIKNIEKTSFIVNQSDIKGMEINNKEIEKIFSEENNNKNDSVSKIDINKVNADKLIEISCFDQEKVKKIIALRKNNIYIESFDDLKDKFNLNNDEINQLKKEIIISPNVVSDKRVMDL